MNPFADELIAWFEVHAADLPWRRERQPYGVWLSEIMLQQTQVDTVVGYYERFLARFPSVDVLAAAPLDDILKLWEGLGYYSRARNLHRAAQVIVEKWGGCFPDNARDLETLPGIGRYTAAAIASLAFGEDVAVLDGNVIRVLTRLFDIAEDVSLQAVKNRLWERAQALVPAGRAGPYNEAMMELGRVICRPRNPLCDACPIQAHCLAAAAGVQDERPVKRRRAPTPHVDVVAGVIHGRNGQAGRILIARRPPNGLLGGLWEFPGGKVEDGEAMTQALARELAEELGISVDVGDLLVRVKHAFTHFRITLHAYECWHTTGEPQALDVDDFSWVTVDEMETYAFGKADQRIIQELRERPKRLL